MNDGDVLSRASEGARWPLGGGTQWAVAAVLGGLLAVVLITGYFFVQSFRLEQAQSLAESDALARGVVSSILAREEGYLNILQAYAGRFRFREAIKRKDRAEALVHLRQIADSFPELDRPFLADPAGVVWAIYPEAPQLYGRSFADRDWYRGVSREWRPYMSEVYPSARDQALIVSLVAPIRDLDGGVIGIIGSAQRLDTIRRWLLPIQVPDGDLYVVDRKGQFVFHRTRTGPEHLSDYARVEVVQRLLKGEEGVAETENAVKGEVRLSAYRSLPALGWGVVVHRSKNLALQRTRTLMLASGGAGLFLAVALGVLGVLAIRNQRQTIVALRALQEKTERLQAAQEELVGKERLAILGQQAVRMRALFQASLALTTEASLERVLQKIADVARDVLGARYAALGVLDESGTALSQFLTSGIDEATKTAIGPVPTGKGILGLLIRERRPIRLRDLSAHARASGFPPNHPRMRSFLGVPINVRGKVYGNLYLTEKQDGEEFSDTDETVALMLAAQAGIVIENVQTFERLQRLSQELEQKVEQRTGELREAKQEAERANQAKSEFLSRMSHELRTPLNAVLGFAQLLEMESLGSEQQESVQHILKAGRHLLELINEVLDISRIESGRLTISPEPILLREFLLEVQDLVQPLAAVRHVELEGRATELWGRHVLADRQRLKQVLLNLLSNAIKFNRDPGTVTVSVEDAPGDHLRIKVADTGLGIPPEKMARLFTAFDRLGAEQTGVEGAGLGLALSKRLVELMGGTIGVDSTVGEGSTFWVELPGVEGPVEQIERTVEGVTAAVKGSGVLGTVLYIEDNLSNLRLVERILAHRPDVRLLSAMQGRLGLELAREHRPDLIFLDLHLPDIPGGEVLRRLQADGKTHRIPVVVISADATSGQIQRLLAEGARDYLTKPLDVKKLITLVDETLRKEGGR